MNFNKNFSLVLICVFLIPFVFGATYYEDCVSGCDGYTNNFSQYDNLLLKLSDATEMNIYFKNDTNFVIGQLHTYNFTTKPHSFYNGIKVEPKIFESYYIDIEIDKNTTRYIQSSTNSLDTTNVIENTIEWYWHYNTYWNKGNRRTGMGYTRTDWILAGWIPFAVLNIDNYTINCPVNFNFTNSMWYYLNNSNYFSFNETYMNIFQPNMTITIMGSNYDFIINNTNVNFLNTENNITITNDILNNITIINDIQNNFSVSVNPNNINTNYNYNNQNITLNIENNHNFTSYLYNDIFNNYSISIDNYNNMSVVNLNDNQIDIFNNQNITINAPNNVTIYLNGNESFFNYNNADISLYLNQTGTYYFDLYSNITIPLTLNNQVDFYSSLNNTCYAFLNQSLNFTCNPSLSCSGINGNISTTPSDINVFINNTFPGAGDKIYNFGELDDEWKSILYGIIGIIVIVIIIYLYRNKKNSNKNEEKNEKTTSFKDVKDKLKEKFKIRRI